MELGAAIPDGSRILLDTAPLIYLFEDHPLLARFAGLFERIEAGRLSVVVTPITLAEVVTGPLQHGNEILAERYRRALTERPGWALAAIDADLAVLAARLRLRYRLRLPDAVQLAATLRHHCDALVTHDRDFRDVVEVPVYGADR